MLKYINLVVLDRSEMWAGEAEKMGSCQFEGHPFPKSDDVSLLFLNRSKPYPILLFTTGHL
jgi:hypothetical protein